jgi:ribulose-phosphate 3-epimerase
MISDPDRYIGAFAESGAAMLSVHVEVLPSTSIATIEDVAADVDFVLVMSVNPGFGGQRFIEHAVGKIRRLRALLDAAGNAAPIEVDGGIDVQTAPRVVAAGARLACGGRTRLTHA